MARPERIIVRPSLVSLVVGVVAVGRSLQEISDAVGSEQCRSPVLVLLAEASTSISKVKRACNVLLRQLPYDCATRQISGTDLLYT